MRKTIAFAAVLALAACNNADTEAETDANGTGTASTSGDMVQNPAAEVLEGDAPGFEAVAPGTYQVTRSGGEVDYIEIHPGMTFSRVAADGSATGGVIFMKGGQSCFLVEGAQQENCFSDGPRQPDGSMQTTSAEGNVSTIRPVEGSLEDHVDVAN